MIDSERFLGIAETFPEAKRQALALLCDKAAFRRTLQGAGNAPAVSSRTYRRDELLGELAWAALRRELGSAPDGLVIKPVRGFQSDLVSICRNADDWERARARIRTPPQGISPVTDASTFVVETYVEGDELAIDVYFDGDGAPVVTGIYLHPFRDPLDARDIVYRTSRELMERHREPFERALSAWNERLGLRDYPVHAEVRVTERGEIFPIEFNPLRFGLLTLDIALYAFGVNAYEMFFERRRPDWEERLNGKDGARATGLIVAPMPDVEREGVEVDYAGFEADLRARGLEIRHLEKLPYREIPFYAAVYVSGRAEAMDGYLFEDFGRWVGRRRTSVTGLMSANGAL